MNNPEQKYGFDCAKCSKTLQLEADIFRRFYKGHTLCLSCRPVIELQKVILSEAEVNQLENFAAAMDGLNETDSYKIIESHRLLIAANAEISFKNNELNKKFNKSLEWLESIEKEFYYIEDLELHRCKSQAKCALEELK